MTSWYTSDTHFFHENVIKYSNRPYKDKHHMNDEMVKNWNSVVKQTDTVYHLGDFAFCRADQLVELRKRLNGEIVLILGNHDKQLARDQALRGLFKQVLTYLEVYEQDSSHERGKQFMVLCHYPMVSWNKAHHGAWMLHGHCHGNLRYPFNGKILDVGVDAAGQYFPINYTQIKKLMAKKGRDVLDHHV